MARNLERIALAGVVGVGILTPASEVKAVSVESSLLVTNNGIVRSLQNDPMEQFLASRGMRIGGLGGELRSVEQQSNSLVNVAGFPAAPNGAVELADGANFAYSNRNFRAFAAEPGALLVGPEFPQSEIIRSGNRISRINPTTQRIIEDSYGQVNIPEGGFTLSSFGSVRAEMTGNDGEVMALDFLPQGDDHMHVLVIRGLYPAEGDRNRILRFTDLGNGTFGGNNQTLRYVPPRNSNLAFISAGQMDQIIGSGFHEDKFETNSNCGDNRDNQCAVLTVTYVDLNTKAYSIVSGVTPQNRMGTMVAGNYQP